MGWDVFVCLTFRLLSLSGLFTLSCSSSSSSSSAVGSLIPKLNVAVSVFCARLCICLCLCVLGALTLLLVTTTITTTTLRSVIITRHRRLHIILSSRILRKSHLDAPSILQSHVFDAHDGWPPRVRNVLSGIGLWGAVGAFHCLGFDCVCGCSGGGGGFFVGRRLVLLLLSLLFLVYRCGFRCGGG